MEEVGMRAVFVVQFGECVFEGKLDGLDGFVCHLGRQRKDQDFAGGGEDVQANAVDSKGVDFSALIGKIASAKLDVNGDGKIDINDASSFLSDLLGDGANGENKGLSLGSLLKTFKI